MAQVDILLALHNALLDGKFTIFQQLNLLLNVNLQYIKKKSLLPMWHIGKKLKKELQT
jgi:hypothetical protein